MTTPKATIAIVFLILCGPAAAQPPLRPAEPARSVTLSLGEYNRLLDLAGRPRAAVSVAPVAAVVARADLRVTVDRENVRGVFNLAGNVLHTGISRVALMSGATLIDANAAGRPVPLVADGTALMALVSGPSPFSLALEWGAPLLFRPGRASFVLPVPQAGSARASIDLPGEQADVRLSAGLITRRTVANGRTIVEATLDPGSSTEVWWSMRDSAPVAAARDVRTLAEVMTLVTLSDSDVRMVALIDVTVARGELRTLALRLPPGYELTSLTGNSLETSEPGEDSVVLTVGNPAARNHQFLVNLERPHAGGSFDLDTGLVSVRDVQRERGEVAVEGVGTMDLIAAERDGVHRIDVRELNRALHSLARLPILSGFRYQRPAGAAAPSLSLSVKRFADAGVLAAVADYAVATTLVTSEGRALTEVRLQVQNRAQPFLKVTLPPGASIVSVDLAGEPAKPVLGADGTRVPLMRAGLLGRGSYQVSFVYVHAGTPFERKGDIQMALPKMDIPIGVVNWEVFVPEKYSARAIGGNAIEGRAFEGRYHRHAPAPPRPAMSPSPTFSPRGRIRVSLASDALSGQIRGRTSDVSGATMPGVTIDLIVGGYHQSIISQADGSFVFSGVPAGQVRLTASLAGFTSLMTTFAFDERPMRVDFELEVGMLMEFVTVTGEAPVLDRAPVPPSQNVINLQQRASGVLPIRVDVPRAGTSHQFVKPLVVDEETVVRLRYKRR